MKEKKKFKIRNIFKSRVFFFILGLFLASIVGVGATTLLYSSDVMYDNSSSGMSSTNLQDALDELYEQAKSGGSGVQSVNCDDDGECIVTCKQGNPTITSSGYSCTTTTAETVTCPSGTFYVAKSTGYICSSGSLKTLSLGDYVSMTPTLTSYSTNTSYTGSGTSVKTINPSELKLWRVIHKNEDGTIDVISEYVSSVNIMFYQYANTIPFMYFIYQLNLLASSYENELYTTGSRYFGYSNQNEIENNDSADTGYTIDFGYLSEAGVSLKTNKVGTTTATAYWVASRKKGSYDGGIARQGRYINTSGTLSYSTSMTEVTQEFALRPIVVLKSTIKISGGSGTATDPFTLSAS